MQTISFITPTRGNRPHLFAIMERSIARQTVQPDQWLVVCDGSGLDADYVPYHYNRNQILLRRNPYHVNHGLHSVCENYLFGLEHATGDYIFCIEDDEIYLDPYYVQNMLDELKSNDLVGLNHAFYYNVKDDSYLYCTNASHASLCSTAFTRAVIPTFKQICMLGNPFIDMSLWPHWMQTLKGSYKLLRNEMRVVSLKDGKGVGDSHSDTSEYTPDPKNFYLKKILGDFYLMLREPDKDLLDFLMEWKCKESNETRATTLACADYIGHILKQFLEDREDETGDNEPPVSPD